MVFPTFFNLSLNLAIRSSWSEPQSAPGLVSVDCVEFLHLWLQGIESVWFWHWPSGVSTGRVVASCIVVRRCLLWPVHSLGKTLLAFVLLHFVLQGQTCLLFQVSLDFLLLHSSPLWWEWKSLSRVQLFSTPWTAAYQAPPPIGFSRQEYWSGLPLPSPRPSRTNTKKTKDVLFIIGDWNAKVESQEIPGVTGKFGLENKMKQGKG